jgi:hypothetical protein
VYVEKISPHVGLANVRVTFHNKVPLGARSQMAHNVRAKQDYSHKVRREPETKTIIEVGAPDILKK